MNSEEMLALARKGVEPYAGMYGYTAREEQANERETHLPRVARQLLLTVLTIVGLIFLAQLFKGYFHSEVFSGVFESTAVMTFLISPMLIFGKRMEPKEEEEFLRNHPVDTEDFIKDQNITTDPTYSSCDFSGWYNPLTDD